MVPKATPFHPPYSLMISTAIRSLGDAKGATASSISEYIKANFAGLPCGHEKLLPYYLNKLTAQGEFVRRAEGRYIVDGGEIEPVANRSDDEGVPIACEGDLVMEVQPIATVAQPLQRKGVQPERRRVRSSAAQSAEKAEPVGPNGDGVEPAKSLLREREVEFAEEELALVRTESVTEVPKRRGRLPKRSGPNGDDVEPAKSLLREQEVEFVEEELALVQTESVTEVPKRRGRLPKRKRTSDGDVEPVQLADLSPLVVVGNADVDGLETVSEGVERLDASSLVPERRGRRPKRKHNGDTTKPMPKRRGRPPKGNHEPIQSSKDDMTHDGEVELPKKKRKSKKHPDKNFDTQFSEPDPEVNSETKQVKKRLGRPPKGKPKLVVCEDEEERLVDNHEKSNTGNSNSVSKRRGRPPRPTPDTVDS